ncbi:hypothetical protein BLOT_010014 [Blomia tropicalis]|nr:hypothetical protein BLOT_010014 [Blomia tropicalis]
MSSFSFRFVSFRPLSPLRSLTTYDGHIPDDHNPILILHQIFTYQGSNRFIFGVRSKLNKKNVLESTIFSGKLYLSILFANPHPPHKNCSDNK